MKKLYLLALFPLLFTDTVSAQDLLERFLANPKAASGEFTQTGGKSFETGKVIVGSQGQLRWEQLTPYSTLVVSNGQQAWHVEPDLQQAVRVDPKQTQGWATMFGNRAELLKRYKIANEGQVMKFVPRQADLPAGAVVFDAQGNPKAVTFESLQGKPVSIVFKNWKRIDAPKSMFNYIPPKGMSVVEG